MTLKKDQQERLEELMGKRFDFNSIQYRPRGHQLEEDTHLFVKKKTDTFPVFPVSRGVVLAGLLGVVGRNRPVQAARL